MTEYEAFHQALEDKGIELVRGMARCPSHDDDKASLHVTEGEDGRVLAYCFAGCSFASVVGVLGLDLGSVDGPRAVDRYTYTDRQGTPLIRVTRREPKGFSQEHWEASGWVSGVPASVPRTLYRLQEVVSAARAGRRIYLVEGEKDVEVLRLFGQVATTNAGGVGSWASVDRSPLSGADVTIIADDDPQGRAGAEVRAASLVGEVRTVEVRLPRAGKDVTDHLYAGYGLDDLKPFDEGKWDEWWTDLPEQSWLVPGVLERGTIVWAYGAKGKGKSMFFQALGARLSNQGHQITYYDEENPWGTTARRLFRLDPDRRLFRIHSLRKLDLTNEEWVKDVIASNIGTDLMVFDSYVRTWKEPDSNEAAIRCVETLSRIRTATGATIIMIDHTGFGKQLDDGTIVEPDHARQASTKGQQADMEIQFFEKEAWRGPGYPYRFKIVNNKASRIGNPFTHNLAIVDTVGGGLALMDEAGPGIFLGEKEQDSTTRDEATISPEPVVEGDEVDGATHSRRASSPPDTKLAFKQAKERLALERLKRELGATEVNDDRAE